MIDKKSKLLKKNVWYRVRVDYNFEQIKITIQSDEIREHKVLFDRKLQGLHRGTIGWGSKGIYI